MNSNEIRELRQQLATKLKALIRNPVIEEMELAAFDLLMSRRQFLQGAHLAMVGMLVAASLPPSVWAKHDPKLKVCPDDRFPTAAEQASVGVAAQVLTSTELFQDTIYAQSVVSLPRSALMP